jgi:hypothetical protein
MASEEGPAHWTTDSGTGDARQGVSDLDDSLRANISETPPVVLINEQGEEGSSDDFRFSQAALAAAARAV